MSNYFVSTDDETFVAQGYGNFIHLSSIMGVVPPKFENYEGTSMTSPIEYTAIKSGVISYKLAGKILQIQKYPRQLCQPRRHSGSTA